MRVMSCIASLAMLLLHMPKQSPTADLPEEEEEA